MNEEQIVRRGAIASTVLQSEDHIWFYNHLKSLILESISQTNTDETAQRERLYFQHRAIDDLLGIMVSYRDAAQAIQEKNESD
jgi:hypothetical protein